MREPHLFGVKLAECLGQFVPIRVIGDHQRQFYLPLPRARPHTHPARGKDRQRIGEAARPAIGERVGRRKNNLPCEGIARFGGGGRKRSQLHAMRFVESIQRGKCAMHKYGAIITRFAQQTDQTLRLAERVGADQMGALRELRDGFEQLGDLPRIVGMAEDGQAECRLRHEDVAGHRLERCAGRVAAAFVIARNDGGESSPAQHDLRRAEHVAGGH